MKLRFLLSGLLVLAPGVSMAQDTASLTGAVRDSSGGVVIGASVTIRNTDNGLLRELKSNADGAYDAAALPPGRYDVVIVAPGFRKYEARGVTLRVTQNARIDVTLQVGD